MRIDSISITNFRGYRNTVTIPFNDLTVFVGKNDVGKSSVLEALDIFFHDGKGIIKSDKRDVNVKESRQGNQDFVLSVVFDELPEVVTIDSSSTTSLEAEYLLNTDEKLEIIKRFHNGSSPKVYIKAMHPTNPGCKDLLLKKNTELKTIVDRNGIDCENRSNNAVLRKTIWNHYLNDLQLELCEIEASKEDAKVIWEKLSTYMPSYSLFQSDRKNTEEDSEVQDPLQTAVRQIISDPDVQATLNSVADIVTQKLHEVSNRTLEKLNEMDSGIACSLNPVIPNASELKWADVFKKVSISGDEDIPLNKRGSGVKRLILLNFFRAEAEHRSQVGESNGIIYAIEEPETSQHSENQRVLIQALKTLASSPNVQVILTTHSGIVVKELNYDNIRIISDVNEEKQVLVVESTVLQYPSLNEINFSVFGEVTEEYHNELFGYLELHHWLNDYKQGKIQYPYLRDNKGLVTTKQLTKTEIIRHQIHHPENTYNARFSRQELLDSIETMRNYIRSRSEAEGIWDPAEEY